MASERVEDPNIHEGTLTACYLTRNWLQRYPTLRCLSSLLNEGTIVLPIVVGAVVRWVTSEQTLLSRKGVWFRRSLCQ